MPAISRSGAVTNNPEVTRQAPPAEPEPEGQEAPAPEPEPATVEPEPEPEPETQEAPPATSGRVPGTLPDGAPPPVRKPKA